MTTQLDLLMLSVSDIIIISVALIILFTQRKKNQLKQAFLSLLFFVGLWVTPLILKILLQNSEIDPYIFETFSGLGNYYAPVFFFIMTEVFIHTRIKIKIKHLLLLIIPTISSILLITNESHHLLFEVFSSNFNEIVYGKFYFITIIYIYSLYVISMVKLIMYMFKNSGFFSKQSIYILIGSAIPLIINLLGTLKIINISTYTTPITFSLTMLFYSLAIFRFDFLKISPITLQKIVDRMSDSYIILDGNNEIVDYNQTLLTTFKLNNKKLRGTQFSTFIKNFENSDEIYNKFKIAVKKLKDSEKTIIVELNLKNINKNFSVEISNLFSEKIKIGILILLKDITQHVKDMETIQNNQNMLIERERLASLGQMVGGIAHSLKTPIFSVSGGVTELTDLVKEFDDSIGNPTVNNQDMHDIAKDMYTWLQKIRKQISYMAEVITTVKGQAVNLSGDDSVEFTINELFNHTKILMKHELQSALVTLNVINKVDDNTILKGNINSLVQVLNNLISNAIQAYKKEPNKSIDLLAEIKNNDILIKVKDYGPGIPESIKDKLFKEMITTKGKEGTGLGIFMSYSMIKAKFNGDMRFESSENGTEFIIYLPIN